MARIRTIKPEFFRSDDILDISDAAKLLYIALWCEADCKGRFKYNRLLVYAVAPVLEDRGPPAMQELVDQGLIELYEAEGQTIGVIPTFTKHQKVHHTEQPRDFPDNGVLTVKARLLNRKEKEREKEKEKISLSPNGDNSCSTQAPNDTRFDDFWETYPSKRGKQKARAAWKAKKLDRLAESIMDDVKARTERDARWLDGYIPNPATYLNQQRWEDEFTQPAKRATRSDPNYYQDKLARYGNANLRTIDGETVRAPRPTLDQDAGAILEPMGLLGTDDKRH